MAKVIIYNNLDLTETKFTITAPKKNTKGTGKTAYIYTSPVDQVALHLQLTASTDPRLKTPFGISEPLSDNFASGQGRRSLDMSFTNDKLADKIRALEDQIIQQVVQESVKFFGKKLSRTEIQQKFFSVLKYPTNAAYAPLIRTKLSLSGRYTTRVWEFVDGKAHAADSTSITQHGEVMALVKLTSIWMASGRFGLTLDCFDILTYPDTILNVPMLTTDDGSMMFVEEKKEDDNEKKPMGSGSPKIEDDSVSDDAGTRQQHINYGAFDLEQKSL